MRRVSWRWVPVAVVLALLCALPSLAGALLPVSDSHLSPGQLLARIRGSDRVGWSGYAEARGSLALPAVKELGDLPALFGGVTRMRGWWRGPTQWRVDTLALNAEDDASRDARGSWLWQSADRRATRIDGVLDIRLPAPPDLLPAVLGRRLAGSADVQLSSLAPRRVAGRSAQGVRLVPRDGARTTVGAVDIWADGPTGLPLRVDVSPKGRGPSLTSVQLELDLGPPAAALASFRPPAGADVRETEAPDVAALVDRFAPFRLPPRLAGLQRSDRIRPLQGGGVATYGDGLTSFAVLPLPRDIARRIIRGLASTGDGTRGVALTPLVSAVVARADRRAYLLAGSVPAAVLDAALAELAAAPPLLRHA